MSGAWADLLCTCGCPIAAYREAFLRLKKKMLEKSQPENFIAHDAAYETNVDLEEIFEMLKLDCLSCRMKLTASFELDQIM